MQVGSGDSPAMSARPAIRASASAAVLGAEIAARGARARIETGVAGQAGSPEAMRRLQDALAQLKALSVQPLLEKAVAALRAEDHVAAAEWSMQALNKDERCGMAWYCLAIAREKA